MASLGVFFFTTTSVAATSLVSIFVGTISAIGDIDVHVLHYFLQDSYHLELNCIVGERLCGRLEIVLSNSSNNVGILYARCIEFNIMLLSSFKRKFYR